jgi:hypothetical protein
MVGFEFELGRFGMPNQESVMKLVLIGFFCGLILSAFGAAVVVAAYPHPTDVPLGMVLSANNAVQQAKTFALSHVSPKVLVRVQQADGTIKFVPVAEQSAEAKAAEFRSQGLWAQVQYPDEK